MRRIRLLASRGLLQIFFALVLIITIMFVSNYYVYRNSISAIYDQVSENNRLVVKNIIQSFDNTFKEINDVIDAIHALPYNSFEEIKEGGFIDRSNVYMLQEEITRIVSNIDYIEDVAVFFNNSNLAVTSKGTSSIDQLFNYKYRHPLYNAEYWRLLSLSNHPFRVFPSDNYTVTTESFVSKNKKLLVVVGGNRIKLSNKHIMLLINEEKLLEQVNQTTMMPDTSLIVLDSDRNVILSTDNNLDLMEILNDDSNKEYEYNVFVSEYNSFTYVNKLPYKFTNVNPVTEANRLVMISTIIGVVILSILLSIILYNPIRDILKLLGGGNNRGNDFREIYNRIVKMKNENKDFQEQLDMKDAKMRREIFIRILKSDSQFHEDELQIVKEYPFFRNKRFVMVSLYIKRLISEKESTLVREEDLLEPLQRDLGSTVPNSVVFHMENMHFLMVIGLQHESERTEMMRKVEAYITGVFHARISHYTWIAFISPAYVAKLEKFHHAYVDLINGRKYRNIALQGPLFDLEAFRPSKEIYYPIEKIEKLSIYIASGNDTESIRMVNEIIEESLKRNIRYFQLEHIAKSIFLNIQNKFEPSILQSLNIHAKEKEFYERLEDVFDHTEVHNLLLNTVQFFLDKQKKDASAKLNPDFILQYIELHYMENLYLDHMAEIFHTTPKYFSNHFKKTFGINFVEYLNKVRLSHAKHYLENTELGITEIGERIGYLNSSTFTSTFKKYFGVAPSEYRKKSFIQGKEWNLDESSSSSR